MSVDYSANFGIGYEVIHDHMIGGGLSEYIDCEIGAGFTCITSGNNWSGQEGKVFTVLDNPFEGGLDLTLVKESLDKELKRLKVTPIGSFGTVGGLLIC